MNPLNNFAVVKKATGRVETIGDTNFPGDLQRDFPDYPIAEYEFHDMTEKEPFPNTEGADLSDLTIDDATGEYKLVTSLAAIASRYKTARQIVAQEFIVNLRLKKKEAQALNYSDLTSDLQRRIDELEAELLQI